MVTGQDNLGSRTGPDVSIVVPCYNEEEVIRYTIPRLTATFQKAGHRLELVAVDNGSHDRTGQIIQELAARDSAVVFHRVAENDGYGNGILSGIPLCSAPWVGLVAADGQVDAEDVVRLYESVAASNGEVLGKVRRRFRMDGLLRKMVSVSYNLYFRILWPSLRSIDINGNPKFVRRTHLLRMNLQSKDWLLDPEIMVKAHHIGLRTLEFSVFARMRGGGLSHVRPRTCWEFFWGLLSARLSGRWARELKRAGVAAEECSDTLRQQ
jgi:glycosyltransferase involved in cell wall biosynthesis